MTTLGTKGFETSFYEIEPPIDWNIGPDTVVPAVADQLIDDLGAHGIAVNYGLLFWDKVGHAAGEELSTPRFKTEEQIQDFLDYVRVIVGQLKGRVSYYTIWSEPDNCGGTPQSGGDIKCIEPLDYINLARRVIPVIREEDPQAKVVLAPVVLFFGSEWLFTVLDSDVVQLFDVIAWHPFYDAAPDVPFFGSYYYDYPSIIGQIKQMASAQGFEGEYWGHDLDWMVIGDPNRPPEFFIWEAHTEIQSAKYYARVTVIQLGLDVGVGLENIWSHIPVSYATMSNLNTVMDQASPISLDVKIQSAATNITSYGFSLPNGDRLLALWNDDAAVDDDPGVGATLIFPGLSASRVVGIDVFNGVEQELITDGNLVIRNLLVKDYPLILRLID